MRDLVAVLAEPNRRRLLELLLGGEETAGNLASHFGVTRPAISQHLGVLAQAGLVQVRREGRFRFYRVVPEGLAELRASLDVFWSQELEQLATAARGAKGVKMSIDKSVLVPLGADETFALLTEPERLRRWQAVTARIDLRAGGDYRWTIVPGHTAVGKVVEVEAGRRLVITWGWEGTEDLPPGASTLTITLQPAEGGTLVRLVHDGLDTDQATGHGEGWDHYLARLVAAAERGDAGLDEWAASPDPLDALSAAEASLALCESVLRNLTGSEGSSPTPCEHFDLDELVAHLCSSVRSLGAMVGATPGEPAGASAEERVADAGQAALEAWRRHGVEGEVPFGDAPFPAASAVGILSIEFLVHAWDMARASSQRLEASEALSAFVLGQAQQVIAPEMRDGDRFAPEVQPAPGAGALERLVAFTGRVP